MPDIQLNGQSLITTSATSAPASGITETWAVTALAAGIPALAVGQSYALVDATSGATAVQQAEIVRVVTATVGATSITVIRGADGTTPVAHAATSTFYIIAVASALMQGGYELDYTENTTGAPIGANQTGVVQIGGMLLAIAPTPQPWVLEWGVHFEVVTAASGFAYAIVYDTTSAGSTLVGQTIRPITAANTGYAAYLGEAHNLKRMQPTTVWKFYTLYISTVADSAANAVYALNDPNYPSWMRAYVP